MRLLYTSLFGDSVMTMPLSELLMWLYPTIESWVLRESVIPVLGLSYTQLLSIRMFSQSREQMMPIPAFLYTKLLVICISLVPLWGSIAYLWLWWYLLSSMTMFSAPFE